jgi:hypothetical protein
MKTFFRCTAAEFLKSRRTIYLLAVFVMPTILSLFNFLLMFGANHQVGYYDSPTGWVQFGHNTYTFWAFFALPALLVMTSAFLAHIEHDTKQWRRLMALPVPRAPFYMAKMAVVLGLSVVSSLILWVEDILLGLLLSVTRPELGLSMANFTPFRMLYPFLMICVFCLFIAAIHLWFSLRVQNFVLSIGLGLAVILAGFFLSDIPIIGEVFPWSLPTLVYKADTMEALVGGLVYSLVGCLVVTVVGCIDFTRQDILS